MLMNASFSSDGIFSLSPDNFTPELRNARDKLPEHCIGKQCYSLNVKTINGLPATMILVPFSDASQTGAAAFVWLPISVNKQ
jgi:hypothetical protein